MLPTPLPRRVKRRQRILKQSRKPWRISGLEAAANGNHRVALDLYEKAGDLSKPFLARANLQAGNRAKAETLAREAMQAANNDVYPLAVYVEVLHGLEKDDQAKKAFEQLRRVAGTSDLKAPIFDRLADIAAQFGYPVDWRLPAKAPSDVGARPPLAALGPLRWQPVPAPRWTMPDADGQLVSLDDYAGKPVFSYSIWATAASAVVSSSRRLRNVLRTSGTLAFSL